MATAELRRKAIAAALCDFFRCPTTGKVIDGLKGDDKVLCGCGETNPRVSGVGHREAPGVHIKAYLETATVDEWIAQHEKPKFYECGGCGHYHPATFRGDCRDDENRFETMVLDAQYGALGWDEIPCPGGE
jgi:hypothetical protein